MTVVTERHGPVLVVRMQREEKRNALDGVLSRGIEAAVDVLHDDPALRVAVLTGTVNVFSAGTDLRDGAAARTDRGGEYGFVRRRRTKPVIAAVEGPAFGGGFELALACDLIVASATARFGLPETLRGVVPTSGAMFRGPRALPLNVVRHLMLTGDELSADAAQRLGLVSDVADAGGAVDAAVALGRRIAKAGPTAVAQVLHTLDRLAHDADLAGWDATARAAEVIVSSDEYREGVTAFLEKRPPSWVAQSDVAGDAPPA